jgi:hypothetical protein
MYDPYAAAMSAEKRKSDGVWFGQMFIDACAVFIKKGGKKVPFNPAIHEEKYRYAQLRLELIPLPDYDVTFTISREMIAEFDEWTCVTLPSVKALNVDLRNMDKAWVRIKLQPTGEKYTNKRGEEVERTAMIFEAVFADEESCRAAWNIYSGELYDQAEEIAPDNNKEKATAALFLKPLWTQAGGDPAKMATLLAGNPLTAKYFTVESPEVVALIEPEIPF